jgi:hypothetical protein
MSFDFSCSQEHAPMKAAVSSPATIGYILQIALFHFDYGIDQNCRRTFWDPA